jgi:hypothetical protein
MSMQSSDVLTLLLGGGAVATISAAFKGIETLRSGARAREKDTVKQLVDQRDEAWVDRDNAIDERDYWRNWAGRLEYGLQQHGVDMPEKPPFPVPKIFKATNGEQ